MVSTIIGMVVLTTTRGNTMSDKAERFKAKVAEMTGKELIETHYIAVNQYATAEVGSYVHESSADMIRIVEDELKNRLEA